MATPNHSKCDRVEEIRSRFLVRKNPELDTRAMELGKDINRRAG